MKPKDLRFMVLLSAALIVLTAVILVKNKQTRKFNRTTNISEQTFEVSETPTPTLGQTDQQNQPITFPTGFSNQAPEVSM